MIVFNFFVEILLPEERRDKLSLLDSHSGKMSANVIDFLSSTLSKIFLSME